jgi:hypothetical protein
MKKDSFKTVVIFRRFKGEIIALFPYEREQTGFVYHTCISVNMVRPLILMLFPIRNHVKRLNINLCLTNWKT